jgi:hypothetical protein
LEKPGKGEVTKNSFSFRTFENKVNRYIEDLLIFGRTDKGKSEKSGNIKENERFLEVFSVSLDFESFLCWCFTRYRNRD